MLKKTKHTTKTIANADANTDANADANAFPPLKQRETTGHKVAKKRKNWHFVIFEKIFPSQFSMLMMLRISINLKYNLNYLVKFNQIQICDNFFQKIKKTLINVILNSQHFLNNLL